MKRNNKGFTLAELLIVVAVIAVLVAVAIPTFGSQLEKSRQATDLANLRDAYAIAKVAALNQEDAEWAGVFRTGGAASGAMKTDATIKAYCNPDAGTLSLTDNTGAGVRKAKTTSWVISLEGLPSGITTTSALASGNDYLVVTFTRDTTTGAYKGVTVTFAANLT